MNCYGAPDAAARPVPTGRFRRFRRRTRSGSRPGRRGVPGTTATRDRRPRQLPRPGRCSFQPSSWRWGSRAASGAKNERSSSWTMTERRSRTQYVIVQLRSRPSVIRATLRNVETHWMTPAHIHTTLNSNRYACILAQKTSFFTSADTNTLLVVTECECVLSLAI